MSEQPQQGDPRGYLPEHEYGTAMAELDEWETAILAASLPPCPHCQQTYEFLPMQGTAWGVSTLHEQGCPASEDDQPASVLDDATRDRLGLPREPLPLSLHVVLRDDENEQEQD